MKYRGLCGWQIGSMALLALGCTARVDLGDRPGTGGAPGTGGTGGKPDTAAAGAESTSDAKAGTTGDSGPAARCGDGRLDESETCDDANVVPGDGCSADCTEVEAGWKCAKAGQVCVRIDLCGDGIVQAGEQCDDGKNSGTSGCSPDCTLEATCGNGLLEVGEACDDGYTLSGDGCRKDCTLESTCGNGLLEAGEQCDDGKNTGTDGTCAPGCVVKSVCGDGKVEGSEQCDDGPNNGEDGTCAPDCTLAGFCGDGLIGSGEECDDANRMDSDGCSAKCTVEADYVCGAPGRPCLPAAVAEDCGDGVVDGRLGEQCDEGDVVTEYGGCDADCQLAPFCGDGKVDPAFGETCDDGNTVDRDGCHSNCRVEAGWTCPIEDAAHPTACVQPVCGNGTMEAAEMCDLGDANSDAYDATGTGCTAGCRIPRHCGDGVVEPDYEECDSGLAEGDETCTANCELTAGTTVPG